MRYKIMRLFLGGSKERDNGIYVLPGGSGPEEEVVIYPVRMEKDLKKLMMLDSYRILFYRGVSGSLLPGIKENLIKKIDERLKNLTLRGSSWFAVGTVLAVFGLVNWLIPDPLPFVDEMILTFGGGIVALAGYNMKRKGSTELEGMASIAKRDIKCIPEGEDAVLSLLKESLELKRDPFSGGRGYMENDLIEAESSWLIKYTDLEKIKLEKGYDPMELRRLVKILGKVFSLEKIMRLENGKYRKKTGRRIGRIKKRIIKKLHFSNDAFGVYSGFYKAAKDFISEDEGFKK